MKFSAPSPHSCQSFPFAKYPSQESSTYELYPTSQRQVQIASYWRRPFPDQSLVKVICGYCSEFITLAVPQYVWTLSFDVLPDFAFGNSGLATWDSKKSCSKSPVLSRARASILSCEFVLPFSLCMFNSGFFCSYCTVWKLSWWRVRRLENGGWTNDWGWWMGLIDQRSSCKKLHLAGMFWESLSI